MENLVLDGFYRCHDCMFARIRGKQPVKSAEELEVTIAVKFQVCNDWNFYRGDPQGNYDVTQPIAVSVAEFLQRDKKQQRLQALGVVEWNAEFLDTWTAGRYYTS